MRTELQLTEGDVIELDASHKLGKIGIFVVYKTTLDGGGTCHGPHDIYPDGHHVFCEQLCLTDLHAPKATVDFYQSGFFTNMLKNIKPIGKAVRVWRLLNI